MKFSFKFNNLLGTVYKEGDLLFTKDGNSVISPVGNKITIFDLKNNKSYTLPIESRYNYTTLDLSPNGLILLAVNEEGEAHIISLISYTIVHRYRFKRKVSAVKFSPDGKHFAVCKQNNGKAPSVLTGEYNSFIMERVFHAAYDTTTCIDWSDDSKLLAVGSKDTNTKIYPLDKWDNFKGSTLGSHTDFIVACFFEKHSFDITTISRNGQMCIWEASINPTDLVPYKLPPKKKRRQYSDEDEDDVDINKIIEKKDELNETLEKFTSDLTINTDENKNQNRLYYKKLCRHYLADEVRKENHEAILTAAAYHKQTKILVTGFSTGAFFIHDMPEVNMIHSLSISNQNIMSISLNNTGDWIALGCSDLGQLLVWEWQSETYVMKQQGHSRNMTSISYSPDGQYIVTGGDDGKVKLWNVKSGFCFVTFQEHTGPVTCVKFSKNKKFIVSSSLDGTVRAFDIIRYRNFRTLTTPRPVQLSCVAVDSSGEFVAAGGQDVFEIFLWSMKLGRLLEILSGHEGPVCSVAFNPLSTSTSMASVSWDKTLRLWDAIEKGSAHETIQLTVDAINVSFKPNGEEVAIATLDGNIQIYDIKTSIHIKSIEGRNDLGSGRSDTDLITAKKILQAKSFTTLCYSADGNYILAGGQSKNICIYNVSEGLIIKKFEITQNFSLDAMSDVINRRKMTEFGNLALVEEREHREGGNVTIKLPGIKKGDVGTRTVKPEVRVFSLEFCPTGQAWAAATTEGLLIYSLNSDFIFDPWELHETITPNSIREALVKQDNLKAIIMAMKLNETELLTEVFESIQYEDVELTITNLSAKYVQRLLKIIVNYLESSVHIEYYLIWIRHLLKIHGSKLKTKENLSTFIVLQKNLLRKYEDFSKICDFNKYTIQCILHMGEKSEEKSASKQNMILDSDDEMKIED